MPERTLTVRVAFRKQASDGNFGSETAEITLEDTLTDADLDAGADPIAEQETLAEALLLQARRQVHAELARSPSANVRRAVGGSPQPARAVPPGPPTDYPDEDPALDAAEARAWR